MKKITKEDLAKQKIVIYKSTNGRASVDIKLLDDTLWLSINQIAELFERDKSVIAKHLRKIFKDAELSRDSVVAKFATTASDGKVYNVDYYNLDAIISVGYKINSKRGTEFRKWASQILKDHLIKGYSLNQKQLNQKSIIELQQTIDLLSKTMISQDLVSDIGAEMLQIIKDYTKTWDTLERFDEDRLENKSKTQITTDINAVTYEDAKLAISTLRTELALENTESLFGQERDSSLKSILGNIEQTFDEKPLYPSIQEKAANLFYLIIKDHPFSDGNKRIGCLLFLMYLKKSGLTLLKSLSNNTLIALALLIAESIPSDKDRMIQLIMYLLQD